MGMNTWTPGRVELLRQLWADGLAGSEIAERMAMTRSMIMGKRYRLGLPCRTAEIQYQAMAANGRRTAARRGHVGKAPPAVAREKRREAAALDRLTKPLAGSNPMPWQLRRFGQCTFPVDGQGGDVWSCCEPVEPHRSYCFGHMEILAGRPWPPIEPANLPAPDEAPGVLQAV